jgi:hypothetical protein
VAAVVGADEQLAGFTILAEWRAPGRPRPKDRDFALGLGPTVLTVDEPLGRTASVSANGEEVLRADHAFDWAAARDLAGSGTALRPGDLLAGPALGVVRGPRARVEIGLAPIGVLVQEVP